MSGAAVPAPDYLFEIVYCDQMNTKFAETKGERDLIYAFHGSRLENFHSILHNGLHCHLNRVRLLLVSPSSLGHFLQIGPNSFRGLKCADVLLLLFSLQCGPLGMVVLHFLVQTKGKTGSGMKPHFPL